MSLMVQPLAFQAMQPVIDQDSVRVDLALKALLRLVPATAEIPPCPPFPPHVDLVSAMDPISSAALDATLDYLTLNRVIEAERVRHPLLEADGVQARVDRLTMRPKGDRMLSTVEGRYSETRWFGASASGTVFLEAKPVFDPVKKTLRFRPFSIDLASKDAFGKVAASLGDLVAPLIEGRI